MENKYNDKIELLLQEYSEYIKAKEKSASENTENHPKDEYKVDAVWPAPNKAVHSVVISGPDEGLKEVRWFPKGDLEKDFDAYKENYFNEYKNGAAFDLESSFKMQSDNMSILQLSDSISKILEPFAALEVDRMDYGDSPIYGDLDKEILSQMAASAYTNAVLNVSELGDLESQSSCCSKEQMLRALIRELIIKEIFFVRRAKRR